MFSCKEIKSFGSKRFEEQLGGITELCAQDDNIKDMTSHWHQSQEPSKEQKYCLKLIKQRKNYLCKQQPPYLKHQSYLI